MSSSLPRGRTNLTERLSLATVGSVDDGKSTLIGRLIYDSKSMMIDQYQSIEQLSQRRGLAHPDFALLTDGLRAEREQGITIDVSYRYFATPKRRFILADSPGHAQYTRNTVTALSTSDLAVVLVDARNGITQQTRRHVVNAAMIGITDIVLAVNKMDLVGFRSSVYEEITNEFNTWVHALYHPVVAAIPMSALFGDNVVESSLNMPWYSGPSLLNYLIEVPLPTSEYDIEYSCMLVQYVLRPQMGSDDGDRAYAGQLVCGTFHTGDTIMVFPSRQQAGISGLNLLGRNVDMVQASQSISIRLDREIDISRGDLISSLLSPVRLTQHIYAMVTHLHERPLTTGDRVLLKHTTSTVHATIADIIYLVDVDTLKHLEKPLSLQMNDLGYVELQTSHQIAILPYASNKTMGSFILIDEVYFDTISAGVIQNSQ